MEREEVEFICICVHTCGNTFIATGLLASIHTYILPSCACASSNNLNLHTVRTFVHSHVASIQPYNNRCLRMCNNSVWLVM